MTIELILRPDKLKSGMQAISIRITNGKKISRKNTGYAVFERDWDFKKREVKRSHPNYIEYNEALKAEVIKVEKVALSLRSKNNEVNAADIVQTAYAKHKLLDIAKEKKEAFKANGQYGSVKKMGTLIGLLREFSPDITVQGLDAHYVRKFKSWRVEGKKAHNTVVSNLSWLRALYRDALIKTRHNPDFDPFDEVVVGTFRAANKKVLEEADIVKLENFKSDKRQELARDVYLCSYFMGGMRFGDTLRLKWSDIKGDQIIITPSKTQGSSGVTLKMKIHRRLQTVLDRQSKDHETVFGLIKTGDAYDIDILNANLGRTFKLVLLGAEIGKNVTYGSARHTFAQIANQKSKRDVFAIKDTLGHTKMATTEIYLGKDQSAIDDLMNLVFD